MRRPTVAVPFTMEIGAAHALFALLEQGELSSLVLSPSDSGTVQAEAVGAFTPTTYSWRLPRRLGRCILFMGTRNALTAPMMAAALRRGVLSIVYWDVSRWRRSLLAVLALDKLFGKALGACERVQVMGHSPCRTFMDWLYAAHIGGGLAAAPLLAKAHLTPVASRIVLACPTLVAGGAERQIVNTALGLRTQGLTDVTVLVANLHTPPGNDFFLARLEAGGVVVRDTAAAADGLLGWEQLAHGPWSSPDGEVALSHLKRLPSALIQDVVDLCTLFMDLRPAVVHCWLDYSNIRAGLAAVAAGVPRVILSGRNVSPIHFPYIHEPFMRAAYRLLVAQPGVRLINNSRGGADDYAAWLGLPAHQIRVIYNGADLDGLRRATPAATRALRQRHGLPDQAPLVGGLFRFSDEKRPLLWLETAARVAKSIPDACFLVFGAGPRQPDMERFIVERGLGGRVKLAPPTPDSALALSAFDLLLLTSQWEGTPNVALEAQAVGTPVVVCGGGGAREALHPGVTGLYVDDGDAARLAAAVCGLLGNALRRAAMTAAAPGFVRSRFSMGRMLTDTIASYGLTAGGTRVSDAAASGNRPGRP
ncbi:glycosyltransferase [uncultured Thiodictyon sp.]|uniref:glycosyltransferase n=1 Tax=uncultured Thiodictyon sp. TaxID=1846217 RepID=UPI0025D1273E|nr:glycosyltransferase [uncultured Thiodictyon sp.]